MINIRKNIFETNSSSTHAMCINKEDDYIKIPRGISIPFTAGEFGWKFDKLDTTIEKASYLYTSLLLYTNIEEAEEIITEALAPYDIECKFIRPIVDTKWGGYTDCYIDHGPCNEFARNMATIPYSIIQFLFNSKSYVVTGNDNCDEEESKWYNNLTNLDSNYVVYERWN